MKHGTYMNLIFTICGWIKFGVINTVFAIYKHYVDDNNQAWYYYFHQM